MWSNSKVAALLFRGLALDDCRKRIMGTDTKIAALIGRETTLSFSFPIHSLLPKKAK
jgi:hypothetical protein